MPLRRLWPQLPTLSLLSWVALLLCIPCQAALSQGSRTPTSDAARPQTSAPYGNNLGRGGGANRETRHRDALGNLCLAVEPLSRPRVANPKVYDHVLVIQNQCLKSIKTRTCYTESDQCIDAEVLGLTRKEVILGISSMIKYFKYDLHEL